MAISSGRKKPGAYDGCDLGNVTDYESLWFKLFIDSLNPSMDGYESWKSCGSWKKFNDLSSKMAFLPVFQTHWLDSDDQT